MGSLENKGEVGVLDDKGIFWSGIMKGHLEKIRGF